MSTINEESQSAGDLCNGSVSSDKGECDTNITYEPNKWEANEAGQDITCEFYINNINNNNNQEYHDDSSNKHLYDFDARIDTTSSSKMYGKVGKTDTETSTTYNDNSSTSRKISKGEVLHDKLPVAEQKNNTAVVETHAPNTAVPLQSRLRGRRGSVVLELNCTTQSFDEKGGSCVENYTSKLVTEDGGNSPDDDGVSNFQDGELVTNRKFEECASKSYRTWEGGDEVLTESEIKFRENEKVVETKEGKKISEYSFRTDESHVSTTYSFEILGDKVLKTARTNRRSSTNSSMKMEKDSMSDMSVKSSSDKDMLSVSSSSEIKAQKAKNEEKFAVSFNSDTSEEEDSDTEDAGSSGDVNDVISSKLAENVVCNGYSEISQEKKKSTDKDVAVSENSSSKELEEQHSTQVSVSNSTNSKSNDLSFKTTTTTAEEQVPFQASSGKVNSGPDVIPAEPSRNETKQLSSDVDINLSDESSVISSTAKKSESSHKESNFSFTVDASENSRSSSTHKKKFTICKIDTIDHIGEMAQKEFTLNKDKKSDSGTVLSATMKEKASSSQQLEITSSSNVTEDLNEIILEASNINEDKVESRLETTSSTITTSQTSEQTCELSSNFTTTEQKVEESTATTFGSQQQNQENSVVNHIETTASKGECESLQSPAAIIDLGNSAVDVQTEVKLSTCPDESVESGSGLIDISSATETCSGNNDESKLQQTAVTTTKAEEKMASVEVSAKNNDNKNMSENSLIRSDFKLSGEVTDKHPEEKIAGEFDIANSPAALDKNHDVTGKDLEKEHLLEDESMEFSMTRRSRKELKNFEDDLEVFSGRDDEPFSSRLKVMDENDGSKTYEKTTTYIAGDRQSTDDLIKRILAEARGEVAATKDRSHFKHTMADIDDMDIRNSQGAAAASSSYYEKRSTNERSSVSRRDNLDDELFESTAAVSDYSHQSADRGFGDDRDKEPSLLERRIASMGFKNVEHPTASSGYDEDFSDTRYSSATNQRMGQYQSGYDMYDREGDTEGSTYKRQQFRSGLMRKQQAVFHDDWDGPGAADEDDDEESYRRKQAEEEYIPDEEFVPKKAEDTDRVVKERTEEIRKVVDNQNNVLQRLKSASDSFDEISQEIKDIKQQFLDSQMRRSMILDEIEHERMLMDQMEHEQQMQQQQSQSQSGASGYSSYLVQKKTPKYLQDDDEQFESKYRPPNSAATKSVELDKELEDDRLGKGTLSSLALGAGGGKSSYSSYAANSSYFDSYKSRFSDDMEVDDHYGGVTRNGYGSSSAGYMPRGRRGRSQSMYEDTGGMDYDVSDFSARTRLSAKYGGDSYRKNRITCDEDDDTASESSSTYRSPNLPSYRKYDYDADSQKSYGASSSSYTPGSYKSRYGNSRSASTSRLAGGLSRSKTLDYNFDSPSSSYDRPSSYGASKYSSSSSSSFNSKFLDKVRQKKAAGEEIKRDKPFSSRFLGKSVDLNSTASFSRPSFGKDDTGGDKASEHGSET